MFGQLKINFQPSEILMYLRKSRSDDPLMTVEQVLEKHEAMLDEWCLRNLGEKIPEENKFREIVSGGECIEERPKFQRVLQLMESPKYKAVICYDCSRISRGDLETAGRIIKLFRFTNTIVITLERIFDIRDEYDRENFERKLKEGNQYLEYYKKIQANGKLLAVSRGDYIGSVPPYGYEKIEREENGQKCHTLKIKEDEATVVRLIFDLYVNKNYGRYKIVEYLDGMKIPPPKVKWSNSTIREILGNIHYIGKVRWNFRKNVAGIENGEVIKKRPEAKINEYLVFEGKHDPIISEEMFQVVQDKRGRNPRVHKNAKVRNPFAGLLFCDKCGRRLYMQTSKKYADRLICPDQRRCNQGSCLFSEVFDNVCEVLQACIEDFEIRIQNNDGDSYKLHLNLVAKLEEQLEELNKKELSQWEKYSEEGMPKHIFDNLNEKVLREKEEVNEALCKARLSTPSPVDYEEKRVMFSDALKALKDKKADPELQNALLKKCIDRIEYHRDRPERIIENDKKTGQIPKGGKWSNPPVTLDIKLRV